MKYLMITLIFMGMNILCKSQGRIQAKELSEKLSPRFANDNSLYGSTYLFAETNPPGYDLLAANLSFTDKNQIQKVGFSPMRLSAKYMYLISNFRINFSHAGGALTSGFSVGNDNSAFETGRVQAIFNDIYSSTNLPESTIPVARERRADETLKEYMEYYKQTPEMKEFQDALLTEFDKRRLKHVVKYSGGYNIQFFPVLNSKSDEGNFDSLNYHSVKYNNLFLKAGYSFNNGFLNFNAAYNYFNKRKAADSTQEKRKYNGYTLGFSVRAISLIKRENLTKKEFYRNSLFVPGIYIGINYDKLNYKGKEAIFAEEKLKWKSVVTISLDFAISPASQFRLAFPIQKTKEFSDIEKKNNNTIAVFQYTFKFINLNDN